MSYKQKPELPRRWFSLYNKKMLCRKKQSILIFCCHCAVNRKTKTQKVLDIK